MNGMINKFQRYSVFDNQMDISIPASFVQENFQQEILKVQPVVWSIKNQQSIVLGQLEQNDMPLREIVFKEKTQLVSKATELKQIGMYSSSNNGIEKYMSEDEFLVDDSYIYMISCAFRYQNVTYIIFNSGKSILKKVIKDNMLIILDSIRFADQRVKFEKKENKENKENKEEAKDVLTKEKTR